jgi:4-hydroxy-3-methylbut-2-enyl diphosphate reductase
MIVIGSPNSSNSQRLAEVARRSGVPSELVERASGVDFGWLEGVRTLGITAGASAPEILVRELVEHLATHFDVTEHQVETTVETMSFKLPRGLAA